MLTVCSAEDFAVPPSAECWLDQLPGAVAIECRGRRQDRWRIVSALVHGNEPSGFFAVHNFLREGRIPETNVSLLVSSVKAARYPPRFQHRFLPGAFDLNRRFSARDSEDEVSSLAAKIRRYIADKTPEAVVDLHNTSGRGPAFAVAVEDNVRIQKLAALFTDRLVITQLVVGSLMEQHFGCPVVTIECGGAAQQSAHNRAIAGLERFVSAESLDTLDGQILHLHRHPVRVTLKPGASLKFGDHCSRDAALTVMHDIERFNSEILEKGRAIAWLHGDLDHILQACDELGRDRIHDFFSVEEGRLTARQNLQLYMATPRTDLALSDCIFYAVPVP